MTKLDTSVKQGQHGHIVVFWRSLKKKRDPSNDGTTEKIPLLKYYKVFNIEQCTNLPEQFGEPLTEPIIDPIAECDDIIQNMPDCPRIMHMHPRTFYRHTDDYINLPHKNSFIRSEGYYSTLFHELVHSTGHEKRLNRATLIEMAPFGSAVYSMEELVAETGSAYLCATSGILPSEILNTAAYL